MFVYRKKIEEYLEFLSNKFFDIEEREYLCCEDVERTKAKIEELSETIKTREERIKGNLTKDEIEIYRDSIGKFYSKKRGYEVQLAEKEGKLDFLSKEKARRKTAIDRLKNGLDEDKKEHKEFMEKFFSHKPSEQSIIEVSSAQPKIEKLSEKAFVEKPLKVKNIKKLVGTNQEAEKKAIDKSSSENLRLYGETYLEFGSFEKTLYILKKKYNISLTPATLTKYFKEGGLLQEKHPELHEFVKCRRVENRRRPREQ